MRIAIVQSDIETAIQKHIRSLMAVAEDAEISMTFSATRGEDGLTAAVNILAPGQVEHVATAKKPKAEKTPAATAAAVATKVAEPAKEVAEGVAETASAKEAPVEAAEEAPAQTAEAAPKNSLFSGLAKPSN